jgi:mono/diheme cytochrome c family protein
MRLFCLVLLSSLLLACGSQNKKSFFHPSLLPTQHFLINPAKDTVLKTAGGVLLHIEKESFAGASDPFTLDVKEALTIQDIVKAGLTTRSNGQLLSSGGMLYVNAADEAIRIVKQLKVSMPTIDYNVNMQLFKGEEKEGEINWTNPKPIRDSMPPSVQNGRIIFGANCSTCHALDKQLTGPALRGVEQRGPWTNRQNLFAWTHNPGGFIPMANYTTCLVQTYNGQIMPSFPQLSDDDLNAIYDYIQWDDTNKNKEPNLCEDSCRRYDSALLAVNRQKQLRNELVQDNGYMSEVFYRDTATDIAGNNSIGTPITTPSEDKVTMEDNRAEYYQFSISAFGWYNVDMLLKERDDLQETKLTVMLRGVTREHVDIYLVVPVVKLFAKAGRTNNPDEFAFYTTDGKIFLPHSVGAYLLAVSETERDPLFAFKEFTIEPSQEISIEVKPATKEDVYRKFESLKLKDVSINVADAKHANEIRELDKAVNVLQNEADKLKPVTCQCSCNVPVSEVMDSMPKVSPVNVAPKP